MAPRNAMGFTLIELMVGIAIVGILIMIALPNFTIWIQNTQIRAGAEGILSGLQLARTEAVRRNADLARALSGERIQQEVVKILRGPVPSVG
ncbi:MAG: prepilin-type N-terminal cleavage/methylation domain-containing protein, partial [Betaproteobacteria bacterium]|nr:prepilin-type N-terminal cleavage/methylation domain-containing protein [Betaproteobacteria bacterium]